MVIDCNDKNGDKKIEGDEFVGDPYFIEIRFIGAGYATEESAATYDLSKGWQDYAEYYPTSDAARDAVGTALEWARMGPWRGKDPKIPGVIPENWKALAGWLTKGAGDPYGHVRYWFDEDD